MPARTDLYQTIIHTIQDAILVLDDEGKIRLVNAAAETLFGYSSDELIGSSLDRVIPNEADHDQGHDVAGSAQSASPEPRIDRTIDVEGYNKNGHCVQLELSLTETRDNQGRFIIGVARDVSEKKRHQEFLLQSEQRFRNLVEITSDWVWETDRNGVYVYASPVVATLLGYSPEDVVGKTPFDFMPEDEAHRISELFFQLATDRSPITALENINLHKNGHPVYLETSGIPILDSDNHLMGYRGIDRDITEKKYVEEEREKLISKLQQTSDKVRQLSGLLPICSSCSKIRDDDGNWTRIEQYITERSNAEFSHSMCPTCAKRLYPDFFK